MKQVAKILSYIFLLYLTYKVLLPIVLFVPLSGRYIREFIEAGAVLSVVLSAFLLIYGVYFKTVAKIYTSICLLYYLFIVFLAISLILSEDGIALHLNDIDEPYVRDIFKNLYLAFTFFFVCFNLGMLYFYRKFILLRKEMPLWYFVPFYLFCGLCLYILNSINLYPLWRTGF